MRRALLALGAIATTACGAARPLDVVVVGPMPRATTLELEPPTTPDCGPSFRLVLEVSRDREHERTEIACEDGSATIHVTRSGFPADAEQSTDEEWRALDLETLASLRELVGSGDLLDCGPGLPGALREIDARVGARSIHGLCTAETLDPRWSELVSGIERALARARERDRSTPDDEVVWPFEAEYWSRAD